jgi:leucyl-tRNA synthetase
MMTFVNELNPMETRPRAILEPFCLLLAPYAPHLAEELWNALGHSESLMWESYPVADPRWLQQEMVEVPVQINGKVRTKVLVPPEITEDQIREQVLADPRVREYTESKEIAKFVWVPGRMVNLVVR